MSELQAIKTQIQNHLVDSGNYDVISKQLKLRLYECGWFDQVSQLAAKEMIKSENINFEVLFEAVRPHAEKLVPADIKEEMLAKIRAYLDGAIQ